jgi:hypothetical protein
MPTSKRLRAPLIVMFGVIIAVVAFAIPANAQPYTTQPTTSVSNQSPTAGSSITFCGQGFQPGETVTITVDNGTTYPSATADTSGAFCKVLVLGASLTGTHTLTATGTTSGSTSSTTIKVLGVSANAAPTSGGAAPTSGGLAFTGANAIGVGALGGLLLLGGAAMVLAGRRRKVND